nr:unnamed protein product [Digitaria exilis]
MGRRGLAGAVVCSMLAHLALLALAASQSPLPRVATSVVGSGREGVLPGAGSEAVAATGAGHEAVVSPNRRRASWETISVSEAGSSVASAKALACACNAGSSCAAAGSKAIPTGVSGAEAVTATCHAGSACATAESDAVTALVFSGAGAKAVAFACHTGSETVSAAGFTGSAAAFVELHAVDILDLSPSFYAQSCPGVELAVRDVVRSASLLDPSIPGKLVRLVFHDCFVEVRNAV